MLTAVEALEKAKSAKQQKSQDFYDSTLIQINKDIEKAAAQGLFKKTFSFPVHIALDFEETIRDIEKYLHSLGYRTRLSQEYLHVYWDEPAEEKEN